MNTPKINPPSWIQTQRRIIRDRAQNKCEDCGAENYTIVNRKTGQLCHPDEPGAIRILLSVDKINKADPGYLKDSNLRARCQKCYRKHSIDGFWTRTTQARKARALIFF